jgi:lycopene cyclase domain-containing protein
VSYLAFLLVFLVSPICLLLYALRAQLVHLPWRALALTALAALVYTAPWDNALIRNGVWSYAHAHVLNVLIGVVPVEEYIFYALQAGLTTLFACYLLRRGAGREQ